MKKSKITKIIWSVDPFEIRGTLLKNTLRFLTHLSAKTRLPVEPVYVVSPLELRVALEFSVPKKERFQTVALQQMNRFLKRIQMPHLLPPKILIERDPSVTESAKAFAKYAAQEKGNLVVVGTHAKKGMQRFFMGSFAETLLFCLEVPVILVNPTVKNDSPLKKILFATDFSEKSKKAFEKVSELASQLHSQLIVYHAFAIPMEDRRKEVEANNLVRRARNKGVRASLLLEKTPLEKYEAILAQSEKTKVDLVSLAAESGKMATAFLGSTTRKVVRRASLPVWVYRPR